MAKNLPNNFIWAAGNSAIQCEGNNIFSDWYYFEKNKPFSKSGEKIGDTVDHYNRFKEDFDLAKSLGQNAHRFTIEWSRVENEKGTYNKKEVQHYREVLTYLRKIGLKSIVTLHHFSNPTWFTLDGGWEKQKNIIHFTNYVKYIANELGDLIDFWVVINEPNTYIGLGYLIGEIPPLKHNPIKAIKVINNMALANNRSYEIIHRRNPKAVVTCANNCQLFTAKNGSTHGPINSLLNYLSNFYFIEKTKDYQDILGLNYYFPARIFNKYILNRTDMDWEIYPYGIRDSILELDKRYKKPIIILENGLADSSDTQRGDYIKSHLEEVLNAINAGATVIGYTYWSLTDNFELAQGFGPKFGLIKVDRKTFDRKIKNSAKIYQKICKTNSLD